MLTSGHKKFWYSALWLLVGQLLLCDLRAQAIRLEGLEIRDAPPLATLVCMYEDDRGFMWFGVPST